MGEPSFKQLPTVWGDYLRAADSRPYILKSAVFRGTITETTGDCHASVLNCGMIATGNHFDLRSAARSTTLARNDV